MDRVIAKHRALLIELVSSGQYDFDETLREALPPQGGVYRIFEKDSTWQSSLWVGRTKKRTLRQRIWENHYRGSADNSQLRKKLTRCGGLAGEEEVARYLEQTCRVQWVEIAGERERMWFEHFALSVLKPIYNNGCAAVCSAAT